MKHIMTAHCSDSTQDEDPCLCPAVRSSPRARTFTTSVQTVLSRGQDLNYITFDCDENDGVLVRTSPTDASRQFYHIQLFHFLTERSFTLTCAFEDVGPRLSFKGKTLSVRRCRTACYSSGCIIARDMAVVSCLDIADVVDMDLDMPCVSIDVTLQ